MASYPQRRDSTVMWVIVGGGVVLAAMVVALVLAAVAIMWSIKKPAIGPAAIQIGGVQQRSVPGRWEVSGSGDHLQLRRITADADGISQIQFNGPDTFTVIGERGSLVFRRRH